MTYQIDQMCLQSLQYGLDETQLGAFNHDCILGGPLCISSGPGTGKTTILSRRAAAHILSGVPPEQFLGMTLTSVAAREMHGRIADLLCRTYYGRAHTEIENFLGDPYSDPAWRDAAQWVNGILKRLTVSTYHSLALKILRAGPPEHPCVTRLGIPADFTLESRERQYELACRILGAPIDKDATKSSTENLIMRPTALIDAAAIARSTLEIPEARYGERERVVSRFIEVWELQHRKQGYLDFSDLPLLAAQLLREHSDVAAEFTGRFRYVQVDEFQDTTAAQFAMLKELCGPETRLIVAGDPDQTIQATRGTTARFLSEFETCFPGAKKLSFKVNYRHGDSLMELTKPFRNGAGDDVAADLSVTARKRRFQTADDEAGFIAAEARAILEEGVIKGLSDIGIMARNAEIADGLAKSFEKAQLPYRFEGFHDFWNMNEVRSARSALIWAAVVAGLKPPAETVMNAEELLDQTCKDEVAAEVNRFAKALPFSSALNRILTAAGYPPETGAQDREEFFERRRVDYLRVMAEQFKPPEGVSDHWLDVLPHFESDLESRERRLVSVEAGKVDAVSIASIQSAKGREWDAVFIPALEEGILPIKHWSMAQLGEQEREFILEEQQRLFLVALSRARYRLYLSHAYSRFYRGKLRFLPPSRYLRRLPRNVHLVREDDLAQMETKERWLYRGKKFWSWLKDDGA